MDRQFWLERWEKGDIAFHRDEVHPALTAYWSKLAIAPRARVVVPLCGKTPDMAWLANEGHHVVGVELSALAIEQFFDERGVNYTMEDGKDFQTYASGPYELWCGDIFELPKEALNGAVAVYDRACLVAFPKDLRERYADFLSDRLPPGTPVLLVSLTYDPREMNGPPFSVPAGEVERLFADAFEISELSTKDALTSNEGLRKRGVTSLIESCYMMRRRQNP